MGTKLLLVFLVISSFLNARDVFPELITDRPDQTESAAVVPYKSLQIETGFVLENNETDLFKQKSFAYNTTLLRYGLFENFELRLGMEFLGEKEQMKNSDTTNTFSGFSPLYAGFKVRIVDEDGWRPEMAILGGLVLPFTANESFKPEYAGGNLRLSFANTLSDKFSLGYNLGAEWDGVNAAPNYFYSIALGVGLTDKLGMFVEGFGLIPEDGDAQNLLDAGFIYLAFPNFQLDISGGIGLNSNAPDNFISTGFTYRLLKSKN